VRQALIRLARISGQPLSELLTVWEPRDLATLADDLEEEMAAARREAGR
jgi:hypothetical protein